MIVRLNEAQTVRYILISPLGGKSTWVHLALHDYAEKINQWRKWEMMLIKPSKLEDRVEKKSEESERIIRAIPRDSLLIVFDERGQHMSSLQWAEELQRLENRGSKALVFVIGGAYGITNELRQKADVVVSMSSWVLNHQVALIVAVEQIYRALSIRHGHPYHHL